MAIYGYARVSTRDQDLTIQRDALKRAGCEIIREEKQTGTSLAKRPELRDLMIFIRSGDTLVVTRIDRLARSMKDLQDISDELQAKGAHLRVTEQDVDTKTSAGKAFFGMLGVFAQFETDLRRERQMEGIAKAKAAGVYAGKGRRRSVDREAILSLKADGLRPTKIASQLGVNRATVYRVCGETAPV